MALARGCPLPKHKRSRHQRGEELTLAVVLCCTWNSMAVLHAGPRPLRAAPVVARTHAPASRALGGSGSSHAPTGAAARRVRSHQLRGPAFGHQRRLGCECFARGGAHQTATAAAAVGAARKGPDLLRSRGRVPPPRAMPLRLLATLAALCGLVQGKAPISSAGRPHRPHCQPCCFAAEDQGGQTAKGVLPMAKVWRLPADKLPASPPPGGQLAERSSRNSCKAAQTVTVRFRSSKTTDCELQRPTLFHGQAPGHSSVAVS